VDTHAKPLMGSIPELFQNTLRNSSSFALWNKIGWTRAWLTAKHFRNRLETGVMLAPKRFIRANFQGSINGRYNRAVAPLGAPKCGLLHPIKLQRDPRSPVKSKSTKSSMGGPQCI
jgi:hypothetical protein